MIRRSTLLRTVRTLSSVAAVAVWLFPLQAQDYNAAVLVQTGQVSVTDGGYQTPLSKGDAVKVQQIIVTGPDGYAQFQVSDGSTFEVFPNSRVVFREHLGNWKDLLNVWLGRVKVFIYHAPGVPNHNQVSSPTAVISVRGTVFDVEVQDDDGTTVVTVDEGLVSVRPLTHPGEPVDLRPGETITVFRNVPLAARQIDRNSVIRAAYKAARDAFYQILLGRQGGPGGAPTGSAGSGTQADKPKPGTTNGPGAPTTTPGAPSTPPPGPGGGG